MKTRLRKLGVWMLLWCGAGIALADSSAVVVIAPAIAARLGIQTAQQSAVAISRAFDAPYTVVTNANNSDDKLVIDNCQQLLTTAPQVVGVRPVSDWSAYQGQLADCHALQWLSRLQPAVRSAMPVALKSARQTSMWPGELWPQPDGSVANVELTGKTLRSVSGAVQWRYRASTPQQPEALWLAANGFDVTLALLARGDFNGDGWEDWLIQKISKARSGTWQEQQSLVLTRRKESVIVISE